MSFSKSLIHFAAPTICEIKPANLFSVKQESFFCVEYRMWKKTLAEYGIALDAVWQSEKSVQVLVYNIRWLKCIMDDRFVLNYLYGKGYVDCHDITGTVQQILSRMKNISPFPHEVGIILGYPIFDVIEFERRGGRECKFCGCWKSYSDVESAKLCHCKFKECSCMCKKWFDEGYPLFRIIEKYKKAVNAV